MNLFSSNSCGNDLADRISALLSIPVVQGDGLPMHASRSGIRQVLAIETKLASLRATAKSSYDRLCDTVGSRKRPKNTSSATGVSPHTSRSRPLAKRLSGSKQRFPENSEYTHKQIHYCSALSESNEDDSGSTGCLASNNCTPTLESNSCPDKTGL